MTDRAQYQQPRENLRYELRHRPTTERVRPIREYVSAGSDFRSFGDALVEGERLQAGDEMLEFQIRQDGEEVYFEDARCIREDTDNGADR